MSDENTNPEVEETSELEMSPSVEDQFHNLGERVNDMLDDTVQRTIKAVGDLLTTQGAPRTERRPPMAVDAANVPTPDGEAPAPERAQVRVSDNRMGRYRSRPAWEQAVRSPDLDDLLARWIRSKWAPERNPDLEARLCRQIDREFGTRADLLIGAPDIPPVFTGTGGPNIPAPLMAMIAAQRDSISKMRSQGFQVQAATSKVSRIRCRGLVEAGMVAEGASGADGTPRYDEVLVDLKKAQTEFNTSREQIVFSPFNLVGDFVSGAGAAFGRIENQQIATSNGNAPNVSESIESVNMTAGPAFGTLGQLTYQELVRLYYSLDEEYRTADAGAAWWGNSNVLSFLSQLADGAGRPIFQGQDSAANAVSETDARQVGRVMGLPVRELPFSTDVLYIGYAGAFLVWDNAGITVDNSESARWSEDMWVWKVTEFFDFHGIDYGENASVNPINGWRVSEAITSVA